MISVVDCTELYNNPIRTGIQRVVRELLRNWPYETTDLRVARFVSGFGLVEIDKASVALLIDESKSIYSDYNLLRVELDLRAKNATPMHLSDETHVFIPEVFFDPERALFHEARICRNPDCLAMLAYDFLPWLRPELFGLRTTAALMHYPRLIRKARHVAFISDQTRRDYAKYILRRQHLEIGPVLPLGTDGLRTERHAWSPERKKFIALGSIDGRKNQHLIVQGFRLLWDSGFPVSLTLIGRAFESADRNWLDVARSYPGFHWIENADDAEVVEALYSARATIYMSSTEGFGLPPVESLAVGIPVITTQNLPSIETLPALGQVRLPTADPTLIAEAVRKILDDAHAEMLWQETAALQLKTWRDFGQATASWLRDLCQTAIESNGY